jgi:hypothetical protein
VSTDKHLVGLIETADTALMAADAALRAIRDYMLSRGEGLGSKNRMLTLAEVAGHMQVSAQKLRKGYKQGRYPFFFRDGARLVTTEPLFGQWLETCAKRAGFAVGLKRAS